VGFTLGLRYNKYIMMEASPLYNAIRLQGRAVVGCANQWPIPLHIVYLQGKDTLSFLQSRTTNDVKALQAGQGQLNTILDAKAHIQGVFACIKDIEQPDAIWLIWQGNPLPQSLLNNLFAFKVIEDVTATILSADHGVLLLGPASQNIVVQASDGQDHWPDISRYSHNLVSIAGESYRYFKVLVAGQSSIVILTKTPLMATTLRTHLLQVANNQCHDLQLLALEETALLHQLLSLEAGWPQYGQDIDDNIILPQTGLELATVSYTKGCYLGQETVARVKTYGAVQRALVGIRIAQWPSHYPLPLSGSFPVSIDGQPVGWITSVGYSPVLDTTVAMAYLDKHHRVPGQTLTLQFAYSDNTAQTLITISAVVTNLPFWTPEHQAKCLLDKGLSCFASSHPEGLNQAIALLESALVLDPALADACEALGVMYSRQGLYAKAIAMMHRLLALDADRVMAHTNLSIYYLKLGDKDRAEEEKAKATVLGMRLKMKEAGLDPTEVETKRLQRETALRERVALFLDALQGNPDDPLGNFGLAMAYIELNELRLAITPLEKTLLAQPKHSVAYLNLGNCYNRLGQTIQAMDVYHRGIAVASQQGDRIPLQTMQQALSALISA
jgi:folate-binding protein YgfZ